ncbi:hypothetical protein MY3296_003427 [Beauveria thailandica]
MDPSKEPDVHPYPDTTYSSEEEGTSAGQLQGPYAVVDRDHQPIDVSSPFIDDWADIDYALDDAIFCPNLSDFHLDDTLGAQPTAQTAQDVSGSNVSSGQIGATVLPSNSEIDLTDMSPDDYDSCADISELDLNDTLEAQLPAPTARDASDLDTSSDQTQAKATPSVSDTSYLDSEVKLLSAKIWEMVHLYWSDIPGLNVASEAQPTAPTAHPSSSNIPDPKDASQAQPTDPTTISSLASDISDLSETLTPESAANTANVVSDFALLGEQLVSTVALLVIARRRLKAATSSASNIPSHSRCEVANRSASNTSSSQRGATATTSASNIPPHSRWEAANRSRWEAANRSAFNGSSSQHEATATTSASNISSSQFWETATTSASNRSSSLRQRWATTTTSAPTRLASPAPIHPFMGLSTFTQRTWAAPTGSTNGQAEHWPAPDASTREWGAAYVPSTAVNETPVLPFDPIWYTPASIRNFKPLPVPPPTYENGGLPSTEPSTEPSSSENLVPDVADDTIDPVKAVNPEAVSGHVSPKIEPRRTIYDFVAAVGAYIRPFFNF